VLRYLQLSLVLALGGSLLPGCALLEEPPTPPFPVIFKAESDPGTPLPGVKISFRNKLLKETDATGVASLSLQGAEGSRYELTVACPEGFRSPDAPTAVTLRRMAQNRAAEFSVSCPPSQRSAVVIVNAEKGPDLPVLYLGKELARTGPTGIAHVLMTFAPGTRFDLTLDTSTSAEKLLPENPTKAFVVGERDDILVFNQAFNIEKKKPRKIRRPPKPKDEGPQRL
jgi:hypothetical protein